VCVIIGVLCLLALLTFSQGAGASDAAGRLFLGMRDWATQVVAVMFFTLGALMYYIVLYKSKLIPRWLSGWGLIGALLGLAAVVIGAFNRELLTGSFNTILNVPIALQEMVLAVWLIVKGFNHSAIAFLSAKTAANGLLSKS
jgi:hypothetical protein